MHLNLMQNVYLVREGSEVMVDMGLLACIVHVQCEGELLFITILMHIYRGRAQRGYVSASRHEHFNAYIQGSRPEGPCACIET